MGLSNVNVKQLFDNMAATVVDSEITKSDKYSILLPTYNERENLPIIIWLIIKYLDNRYLSKQNYMYVNCTVRLINE